MSDTFEPLESKPLKFISLKTLFLLALATAKRVGELQALSAIVPSQGPDLTLSYLLSFVAKTVTVNNPVPDLLFLNPYGISQGILMKGHCFVLLGLCPFIVKEIKGFANRLNALFVSPSNTRRCISKNGISFYLTKLLMTLEPW